MSHVTVFAQRIEEVFESNPNRFVDRVLLEYRSKADADKQDFVAALAQKIREIKMRQGTSR